MEYIVCCSCFKQDKKAVESFAVLFPDKTCPTVVKGRDRIYKLSEKTKNEHIKAISKLSGRFAYYLKMENDKIVEEYDLVTGRRIS